MPQQMLRRKRGLKTVTITFESFNVESSNLQFALLLYLQRIRLKFVYEGHRVKVKVTGAKRSEIPIPTM